MDKKRYHKVRKTIAVLLVLSALGPFVACSSQNAPINADSAYVDTTEDYTKHETNAGVSQETTKGLSLSDVKPSFKPYQDNIAMDEESVLKIIRIAMADAQKFYTDMGAPNMTYDKKLNIVSGNDNFYPEWMDEYFYMGKAMAESSFRVDVITDIKSNPTENDAHGILQICPEGLKSTLEEYYRNIFGVSVDLSDLNVVPSKEDVQQAYYSPQAQANIVRAVYNNIYLAICYDIYNVKCLNPIAHTDFYSAYGGFSEDIRRLAAIGLYGTSRNIVLSGLRNGTLEKDLRAIDDMNTYLNNIAKYEKQFENKYAQNYETGPQR